jgi:hypothetical protein
MTDHVIRAFCFESNEVAHLRQLVANAENFLQLLSGVDQDELRVRMVNDVRDLFR